jgi:hypothetical protein
MGKDNSTVALFVSSVVLDKSTKTWIVICRINLLCLLCLLSTLHEELRAWTMEGS